MRETKKKSNKINDIIIIINNKLGDLWDDTSLLQIKIKSVLQQNKKK